MEPMSLKQIKNKIVTVSLAIIMTFSVMFEFAPISVFATSDSTVQTFTYDGQSHANEIIVSGETIYNMIVEELKEKQKEAGWLAKGAYSLLINSSQLAKVKELGETTPENFNTQFGLLSNLISAIDSKLSIEMTGYKEIKAADANYEIKLNVLGTVITVSKYKINHASLTVTPKNAEIPMGEEASKVNLTYDITGELPGYPAGISGKPELTVADTYTTASLEGSIHQINASAGDLAITNQNYKINYGTGTLTVIAALSDVLAFDLGSRVNDTEVSMTYNAQNQMTALKNEFVADATAALDALTEHTTERAQAKSKIVAENVVITLNGNVVTEMKAAGDYKLTLVAKGVANPQIGNFKNYNYTFTQDVTINKVNGVKITVNSQAGSYQDTYKVYRTKDVPTVGLNLLGFYVEVPNDSSDEIIEEIENAGLVIKKVSGGIGSFTGTLTVDTSSLTNFNIEVFEGVILESSALDGIINEITAEIVSNVTEPLGLPLNLGTYNKTYDGRALANIEGDELTTFSNDVLNKIINALADAKEAFDNSGVSITNNVTIPTINKTIDLGGLSINLEKLYIDEINSIISDVNGLLKQINEGISGISTVNDLIAKVESLGTSNFSLKVSTSNNGLSGTVNAGESTTLTLSLEATLNANLNELIKLTGLNISGITGLNLVVPILVSIPLTKISLGVDALPVTIYYKDTATTFEDNGGVFYQANPEILKAQLTADHYATVNPLNYLLLTDAVKNELGNKVLLTNSVTHTLNSNYDVTIATMTSDKYYGEIAKEITDLVAKLDKEIEELKADIEQAKKDLEAIKNVLTDEYKEAEEKLNQLYEQLAKKEEDIKNALDKVEDMLNNKVDIIINILDSIKGIDTSIIKETLEEYAKEALKGLEDKLKEEAEKIARDILNKAIEELKKLELGEKLEALSDLAEEELKKYLTVLDEQFPLTADLGMATKDYNAKAFTVEETGIVAAILTNTGNVKTAIENFEITALSDVVLSRLLVSYIPEDVQDAYAQATSLLAKLNVDLSKFEATVVDGIDVINTLKDQTEDALNGEIQKLVGEIEKVESILAIANTMSVAELEAELEGINKECKYIKVEVTGETLNKDAKTVDITIQVFSTLKTDYELLSLTAKLKIDPIVLDITVENQIIDRGDSIDQSKFVINTPLASELVQEATDAIVLSADTTTNEITANIANGVVNFELGTVVDGDLLFNIPVISDPDPDTESDSDSEPEPVPVLAPVGAEAETLPTTPEEPEEEVQEEVSNDENEEEQEEVIEEEEVPLAAGDSNSSWWMYALGGLLSLFFILFFFIKRRKKEEEEEELA